MKPSYSRVCGLANPKLMAGAVSSETELSAQMVPEAGISSQEKKHRLRDRAILTAICKQCRKWDEEETVPVTKSGDLEGESGDKRATLLAEFGARHGFLPPLENQPSQSMLTHLIKLHKNRSTEFFPLSRVTNFADGRDIKVEPTRIKGTPFLLESQNPSGARKNQEYLQSAESFCHAVRVLMHGYTIVSMADPRGEEWCDLGAAQRHIATVEGYSRANSRVSHRMHPQIMEAEMATRLEWTKLGQTNPGVSLTAIIDTVAQRHAIWPLNSEITRSGQTKGKGKWSGDWQMNQTRSDKIGVVKRGIVSFSTEICQ